MKNQIFLVFDSLRWDVFKSARAPFLKNLGSWKKAYTQGTYTLPAHMSFFAGKLPQTFDGSDYYDTAATRIGKGRVGRNRQFWQLSNPESQRDAVYTLEGDNIVSGFQRRGYLTLCTGGVNWFNPDLPAGRYLTEAFERRAFFSGPGYQSHESSEEQIQWVLEQLQGSRRPYFLFINFGETHHQFRYKNCPWHAAGNPYGDARECRRRQRLCLEYLDTRVQELLEPLSGYDLVICSDHGEAMGEDGLWGHGFFHRTVMEVPLLIQSETKPAKKGLVDKLFTR